MWTEITIPDLIAIKILLEIELKRSKQNIPTNSLPKEVLEDIELKISKAIYDSNIEVKT